MVEGSGKNFHYHLYFYFEMGQQGVFKNRGHILKGFKTYSIRQRIGETNGKGSS